MEKQVQAVGAQGLVLGHDHHAVEKPVHYGLQHAQLIEHGRVLVLLHELQSYDDLGRIPVVVCTTSANDITLEQLRPYGVRLLLDKVSMHPDDIAKAVREAVEIGRAHV